METQKSFGNISIDWLLTKIYINWIQKLTVTLG